MALPKLNNTPKYEVTIPSVNESLKFRPFLVKEQKVLLIAMESEDQKQILSAIVDTIDACLETDFNVNNLTSFDIEYLFTKIRAKSVGEKSKILSTCSHCEHQNEISIDLDKIKIEDKNKSDKIKITDEFTLKMKYPTYFDISTNDISSEGVADQLYNTAVMSLDKLYTADEIIEMSEEPWNEKQEFIDSLSPDQFEKIMQFMMNSPKLKYSKKYNCESCKKENELTLNGLSDFL